MRTDELDYGIGVKGMKAWDSNCENVHSTWAKIRRRHQDLVETGDHLCVVISGCDISCDNWVIFLGSDQQLTHRRGECVL